MQEPEAQSIADLTNLAKKEIKENSKPAAPVTENKEAMVQVQQNETAVAETPKAEQKQETAAPEA